MLASASLQTPSLEAVYTTRYMVIELDANAFIPVRCRDALAVSGCPTGCVYTGAM